MSHGTPSAAATAAAAASASTAKRTTRGGKRPSDVYAERQKQQLSRNTYITSRSALVEDRARAKEAADKASRELQARRIAIAQSSTRESSSGGGRRVAYNEKDDRRLRDEFIMPKWVRAVPRNIADMQSNHRRCAQNFLIQSGYVYGGVFDGESMAAMRVTAGWNEPTKVLTMFSGSQKGEKGAWFPHSEWKTFIKYYAVDLKHRVEYPLFFNQIVDDQPVTRFALDFDFKGPNEESDALIARIMTVTHAVVCTYRAAVYEHVANSAVRMASASSGISIPGKDDVNDATENDTAQKIVSGILDTAPGSMPRVPVYTCTEARDAAMECRAIVCTTASVRDDIVGRAKRALTAKKLKSEWAMRRLNGDREAVHPDICMGNIEDRVSPQTYAEVKYKRGAHVYWNFFVTVKEALQIRLSIEHALGRYLGPRPPGYNSWEEVVDEGPILKGNLRMIGSHKCLDCVLCAGFEETKPVCPGCYGVGHVIDKREYMPAMILKGPTGTVDEAALDALNADFYQMVMECSLHAPDGQGSSFGTGGMRVPEGEPRVVSPTIKPTTKTMIDIHGNPCTLVTREFPEDKKSNARYRRKGNVMILDDDPEWGVIQTLINETLHVNYAATAVKCISTNATRTQFIVNVTSFGAHYCQRKRGEHNGNTIYFVIYRIGRERRGYIQQRCHCQCSGKPCKDYKGKAHILTQLVSDQLFIREDGSMAGRRGKARREGAGTLLTRVNREADRLEEEEENELAVSGGKRKWIAFEEGDAPSSSSSSSSPSPGQVDDDGVGALRSNRKPSVNRQSAKRARKPSSNALRILAQLKHEAVETQTKPGGGGEAKCPLVGNVENVNRYSAFLQTQDK